MKDIASYIISVTAAGVICGIISSLLGDKGAISEIGKMLAGIFLAIVIVRPLADIRLSGLEDYLSGLSLDGNAAAEEGWKMAEESMAGIIKSETEAYILDKAASMHVDLSVEVIVENTSPPSLSGVRLCGAVSPYAKQQLSRMIEEDLGIARERQTWIGSQ